MKRGTRLMSEAKLAELIPPVTRPQPVVITEDEWQEQYRQMMTPDGGIWGDVGEFINPYTVWTLVETDTDGLAILNGYHLVNRIGYITTIVPWREGDDITVTIDPIEGEGATL